MAGLPPARGRGGVRRRSREHRVPCGAILTSRIQRGPTSKNEFGQRGSRDLRNRFLRFSIKKKGRGEKEAAGSAAVAGAAPWEPGRRLCPSTQGGSTPARSVAGRKPCRRAPGLQLTPAAPSQLPGSHLPACPTSNRPLDPESTERRRPSTTTCNPGAALGSTRPSPSFAAPKHQLLDSQPLRLHRVRKTHRPEPKRHSSHHSVPPLASGTGGLGLPSLHGPPCHNRLRGRRVGTAGFPIAPKAKGQGKEEKNDAVLKMRSAAGDLRSTDRGSDYLCVPERIRQASKQHGTTPRPLFFP